MNGDWNNNSNWTAAFPNTSSEVATFGNNVNTTVSLNVPIQVAQMVFDSASAGSFTLNAGGGTLSLGRASGAVNITMNAAVSGTTQTINPQVRLNGTVNLATVTNSSTTSTFNFAGGFDNTNTTARTLTFAGAGSGGTINGLTQSSTGALSLTFNGSATWDVTGTNTATGALSVNGTGVTVRVSSDLSSTSGTSVTAGILQINNALANGGLSALTQAGTLEALSADRTINTGTHTLNASTFIGSQSLTIQSLGTLNGSTGAITNNIAAGKSLTFSNTNFYLSNDNTTAGRTRTFAGTGETIISSNVASNASGNTVATNILKSDTGTLRLSGTNTYTGTTQITGGVLRLDSAGALGSGQLILNGGVLGLGHSDFTRSLGGTGAAGTVRWGSASSGGFAAYGADRTVNIGGSGTALTWGSTANFVNTGTLFFGAADATHKVTYQNGINLNNAARTIRVDNGSGVVDAEISGVISSTVAASGALTKTGTGTLRLSNTNTYSGVTTVSAGELQVTGSLAGAVDVAGSAKLSGSGTISGAVTLAAASVLAPGTSPGTLTTGALSLNNSSVLSFELNAADQTVGSLVNDLVVVNGNLLLDGILNVTSSALPTGTWRLFNYTGSLTNATLDLGTIVLAPDRTATIDTSTSNQVNLVVTEVPEPAMLSLLGLAGVCLGRRRRVG